MGRGYLEGYGGRGRGLRRARPCRARAGEVEGDRFHRDHRGRKDPGGIADPDPITGRAVGRGAPRQCHRGIRVVGPAIARDQRERRCRWRRRGDRDGLRNNHGPRVAIGVEVLGIVPCASGIHRHRVVLITNLRVRRRCAGPTRAGGRHVAFRDHGDRAVVELAVDAPLTGVDRDRHVDRDAGNLAAEGTLLGGQVARVVGIVIGTGWNVGPTEGQVHLEASG